MLCAYLQLPRTITDANSVILILLLFWLCASFVTYFSGPLVWLYVRLEIRQKLWTGGRPDLYARTDLNYVRLEYSLRRRWTTKSFICIFFDISNSLLILKPPGCGWARRLARSACWSITVERRVCTVTDERTAWACRKRFECQARLPSKYVVQSCRELLRRQVGGVYKREKEFLSCALFFLGPLFQRKGPLGNSIFWVIIYFFCELAFSQIRSFGCGTAT